MHRLASRTWRVWPTDGARRLCQSRCCRFSAGSSTIDSHMPSPVSIDQLRLLVSHEAGVSDWLVIDQPTIDGFAQVTGDHQWIHTDPRRAQTDSRYGHTIAHGFLTLSLLSRLSHDAVDVSGDFSMRINYGL